MSLNDFINNYSSDELEKRFLASILYRNDSLLDVIDIINYKMFEYEENSNIYHYMLKLFEEKSEFDDIILLNKIKESGYISKNPKFNIEQYIDVIKNAETTSIKIKEYAKNIRKRYKKRYAIDKLKKAVEQISVCDDDSIIDNISQNAALDICNIVEDKANSIQKTGLDTDKLLADINLRLITEETIINGKKTGWFNLDIALDGFKNGQLINFTGHESSGKSTWARQYALYRAKENYYKGITDSPVLYFSIEMTKEEIDLAFISQSSNINKEFIEHPKLYFIDTGLEQNTENIKYYNDKIKEHSELVNLLNILIDDSPLMDITSLIAKAKKIKLQYGKIDSIVIDHTDILDVDGVSDDNTRIYKIYKGLKALAKELDTTIVALHQFNSQTKDNKDYRPTTFSLNYGKPIRQNCDVILLLYRPALFDDLIIQRPDLENYCDIAYGKVRGRRRRSPQQMTFDGQKFYEKKDFTTI